MKKEFSNRDIEEQILGAFIAADEFQDKVAIECVQKFASIITPEHFRSPSARRIWAIIEALREQSKAITIQAIRESGDVDSFAAANIMLSDYLPTDLAARFRELDDLRRAERARRSRSRSIPAANPHESSAAVVSIQT